MRKSLACALLALLALLGGTLLGGALLGGATAAPAVAPVEVVVQDDAGVLYQAQLLPALRSIDFYEPTEVAVYTYNGSASDNLNEKVLQYARSNHPEWISADGQKWADGLFIFALDPVGRHVGTYMGEDRKVSLAQREDIQNAGKDLFRDAQWTEGTIAGIRRGAELINQPWYRSWAFVGMLWASGGVVVAGALVWLIVRVRTKTKSRAELARGERSYANVSTDLQVTELNAATIPEGSRYGSIVLEKHRTFLNRYNAATELSNAVHDLTPAALGQRKNLKLVREFAAATTELDALDDVIADTNALLNHASGWATAWDRQVAPLRTDLDGIEDLLARDDAQGDSATAAALRAFRDATRRDLEQWAAELESGRISPESALDRLRDARTELSTLLKNHAETVIEGYARNEREARLMRKEMEGAPNRGGKGKPGQTYGPGILGTVYPSTYFFSVPMFNIGFSSAVTDISAARAGGGGSTTGYGSSGGSFSGPAVLPASKRPLRATSAR